MSNTHLVSLEEIRSHIETAAKDTVLAKIELGRWLQMARDHFKADQEFGKWRQENIPWMSQQSANEHMGVHRKFGHRTCGGELPGFSVLRELAKDTTPEVTVEKVLKDPEGWTVKDVKEQIKADREDIEGPPPKKAAPAKDWRRVQEDINKLSKADRAKLDLDLGDSKLSTNEREALRKHIRRLSQMAHPDKGGSVELMTAINQMKKEIL